ncbi:MAG: E3 ubiquitin ligase family protein [Actinomycetota bacterium]|nr:E3 ubiquitin ligase family protein [Actinomycetota bacterium]
MLWLIVLLVVALGFWAAGGLLLYVRHRTRRKVDLMRQTQTTSASEMSAFSPGTPVEVKGTLRCESPLQSEMAEETCACYFSRVTREYVRSSGHSSDDSPGSHHSRQTASETLSESVRAVPFFVEDSTGRVEVHPQGSEVDAQEVVDRFEPSASPGFTLGGAPVPFDEEANTLGYRYTESVLPIDAPVYVLGVVREEGGIGAGPGPVNAPVEELPLMKGGELASTLPSSRDKERRFVISHRSEEALGQDLARTVFWMAVAAGGALALGAIAAVAGVILAIN